MLSIQYICILFVQDKARLQIDCLLNGVCVALICSTQASQGAGMEWRPYAYIVKSLNGSFDTDLNPAETVGS